jgi:peptidoglycan/LPS O-acetylase OafA/YrhL
VLFLWAPVVGSGFLTALILPIPLFVLMWNRLSHPALLWLGGISYSLYLFNLTLIEALAKAGMPPILFVAASIGFSLVLAAFVYRWVERPMIAWGKAVSAAGPVRNIPETRQAAAGTGRA